MLIDARTLPQETLIETDLCIIGAGAAGLTVAKAFVGHPARVCLLESGGTVYEPDTQALYQGHNAGYTIPLEAMRLRYFGGSTNHWGNYCRPLDPIDFDTRHWVPDSGWPFDKPHLDPYYERAQHLCQLGPYDYDLKTWEHGRARALPFASDRLQTVIFQLRQPPTRFGEVYRDEVVKADNITTMLHANVVDIEPNTAAQHVTRLRVACLQGNAFWVAAKWFVLATGGIENARLLLLSNTVQANGLGNAHDRVGRFFMGHAMLNVGTLLPSDPYLPATLYYEKRETNAISSNGHLALSPQTQRLHQLLNINFNLKPIFVSQDSVGALQRLRRGQFDHFGRDIGHVVRDLDGVAVSIYRQMAKGTLPVASFELGTTMEQAPNPESRVRLADTRDALGYPRVALDWRLSELDIRSLWQTLKIVGAEVGRAGLGRFKVTLHEQAETWPLESGGHHMGTTRMHDNPSAGVVDADCRVHGLDNLFVAGSSVFPTSGHANPTLTLVALAVRLADHLKRIMDLSS